jgi:glucose-1-phosphate thymidylyltransferase
MSDLKIVIPMAGIGKRLEPLTQHKPKALIRLADRRLLDHVLASFQGLRERYELEYVFIIGYLGPQIQEYMKAVHPDKVVTYFVQEQLMGQSHAIHLAKDVMSGPVVLTYCDTISEIDFSSLALESIEGMAFIHHVDDPRRHGIAMVGPDDLVTSLVEKPKSMEHKSALTGVYYLSEGQELIEAIEIQMHTGMTVNNEYYLADAVNILIKGGMRVRAEKVLQWLDAGTPEAVLETNSRLLQRHPRSYEEDLQRSNILIPPVYISKSSQIQYSIIGPNVSVGENCSINGSILKNTIVDDHTNLAGACLVNSLIGKGCSVMSNSTETILADNDQIKIPH